MLKIFSRKSLYYRWVVGWPWPNWPAPCFYIACEPRIYILYVFDDWGKKPQKNNILWYGKIIQLSDFIVHTSAFTAAQPLSFLCVWCDCFRAAKQSWVVAAEPACGYPSFLICSMHCWLHWHRRSLMAWVPWVPQYRSILVFYYQRITCHAKTRKETSAFLDGKADIFSELKPQFQHWFLGTVMKM